MSQIKRLKLEGFKSFAKPTILNFENGFNTVVGANGSGKSNVFDALCFVLGRMSSKGLRADKLGNLVFNGGKDLKPSKQAEVSIYLSNDNKELLNVDLDEVKITRIVNKDGQSKYLLNNQKVTRTEIVEVLGRASIDPDGYNIILQGDIMRIVNMTPNERRELIEEISNISGYEEKRTKALNKLDKVEVDLKEADLLMEEKTKYLKDLKSEKEQAEKFHKTKDDLRYNSLLLVKSKLIRNSHLKQKKEEELEKSELELGEYKEKLEEFENKNKEIDEEINKLEKEIEIKSHGDFIEITNKITLIEAEIQKLKEKKAENKKLQEEVKNREISVKENINSSKDQLKILKSEIEELEKEKKVVEKELAEVEGKLTNLKKSVSSDSFKELDSIDEEIDDLQEKKLNKNHIRQDNAIQVEKLNTKLEHYEEELKKVEGSSAENKTQVADLERYRKELKEVILKVSQSANKNSEDSSKLHKLQQEHSALVESHSKLQIKADQSRELLAQNKAVDSILKLRGRDSEIHGSVVELASVPSKYSQALETVAGKGLFHIVVENDRTAVKYINYLKDQRIGNATFLPLNKVNAKARLDNKVLNKKGVVDYALNLISYDPKYESIFSLIFGDTLVIENIADAKGIGIGEYKMVTMDGDIVARSGAMSGGFKSKRASGGAFKDEDSFEKLERLESKMSSLRSTIDLLKSQREDSEKELYDLRSKKADLEGEIGKLEKILSIEGRDSSSINSEIEAIMGDKIVIENSLKKIDRDIAEIDSKISELQAKKFTLKGDSTHGSVLENIGKVELERDKIKERLIEINSKLDTKNIQLNNVVMPEITNLEKILNETKVAIDKYSSNMKELGENISKLEEELKDYKNKEKELSKGYKEIIAKRDTLKEDKIKLEKKYEKEFVKFDKIKEKLAQLRYAISEFNTLNETLSEELEVLYSEIRAEFVEVDDSGEEKGVERVEDLISQVDKRLDGSPIDVKELQSRVNSLKSRLNSFGSINMKAVEIYDKLNEEFSLLLEKREKLNTEKNEILEFVAEMDDKKKVKFMETFTQLKDQFISFYSKLSSKGEAELEIENENDLFNSGVEIKVRLSRNNYLDIKSLSGGEKTITAVAFIFAVQEFNPAPFYIFDEIDAALDIMNCEKLGKLIASSAHKAQYVVVSHSEYLIQSSSSIYGVTMDKNKISGVVSLDLKDAKEMVDESETEVSTS